MLIIIVPDILSDAINEKLEKAFLVFPEARKDRDVLFHELLEYFDEHGEIPEFELKKKEKR